MRRAIEDVAWPQVEAGPGDRRAANQGAVTHLAVLGAWLVVAGRTVPQDHVGVHDLRPLLHILVDLGIFHLALAIDGDPEIVSRTFFAGAVVSGVPHPQGDQVL